MKAIVTFSILFFSQLVFAQSAKDSLNLQLQSIANEKVLPGFGALIFKDGEVKFSEGFGNANVEKEIPYTNKTLQNIASISKTFIGVALMIAEEKGMVDLDDPINEYLDYEIVNPRRPKEVITIRHLATHTATLKDPDEYEKAYIFEEEIKVDRNLIPKDWSKYIDLYNNNERVSIDEFIKSVYVPGGEYYSRKNFLRKKPGVKYAYSNIGAGIASRIVEKASGMSFEEFTKAYIFDPIGMKNTTWNLGDIDLNEKSLPYLSYGIPLPHYSLITFADGGVITNIEELGLYIEEMMDCYFGEGRILSKEKCREMMRPYLDDSPSPYGIFWEVASGGVRIGHNGGDPGTVTTMYFMPAKKEASIVFVNLMPTGKEELSSLKRLWKTVKDFQARI